MGMPIRPIRPRGLQVLDQREEWLRRTSSISRADKTSRKEMISRVGPCMEGALTDAGRPARPRSHTPARAHTPPTWPCPSRRVTILHVGSEWGIRHSSRRRDRLRPSPRRSPPRARPVASRGRPHPWRGKGSPSRGDLVGSEAHPDPEHRMFVYVGKSYTATVRGSRIVPVTCERCQGRFFYELTHVGIGRARLTISDRHRPRTGPAPRPRRTWSGGWNASRSWSPVPIAGG